MKRYQVSYGYRTDDGMGIATPTHFDTAIVEADDLKAARLKAIDAAHEKHGPNCSHVVIKEASEIA